MKSSPAVSVVMPVYNYGHLIRDSIDSVLAQTMSDFELIVVNDGSSDDSSEVAHSYLDKRIKVIDFPENRGNYPARNTGMRIAQGKYICVMDADDLCFPERLEKQYRFLEENCEVGLIGGAYKTEDNEQPDFRETDYEIIQLLLFQHCYLHHPTCMIRASQVKKHDLYYNELYRYASDHDWQVRASSLFPISNINTPVLLSRKHDKQISTSKQIEQSFFADQIRVKQLSFFGIEPTEIEKVLHLAFVKREIDDRVDEKMIDQWIQQLSEANRKIQYYSQLKLQNCLLALRYLYVHKMKEA
jgi:glycosyltransferase involved in cell wall biosynthesis